MAGSVGRIVVLSGHRVRAFQSRCGLRYAAGIVADTTESLDRSELMKKRGWNMSAPAHRDSLNLPLAVGAPRRDPCLATCWTFASQRFKKGFV